MNKYIVFILLVSGLAAQAADSKELRGHVPKAAAKLAVAGRVSADRQLQLSIGLTLRNQEELTKLLEQLYNPRSTNYHRFLTLESFTQQFGPAEQDYEAAQAFARRHGLSIQKLHPNRMVLDVSGTASNIEKAFGIRLNHYAHPTEKRTFFAPDREPSIDAQLVIQNVQGLSDFVKPRPAGLRPLAGSASGGGYLGNDFRRAYVPGVALAGTGQSVGLLEQLLAEEPNSQETAAWNAWHDRLSSQKDVYALHVFRLFGWGRVAKFVSVNGSTCDRGETLQLLAQQGVTGVTFELCEGLSWS